MPEWMSDPKTFRITTDLIVGSIIMGTTGAVIGLNLGGPVLTVMGTFLGIILGGFISALDARRFFICVLVGMFIGGALALWLGGPYAFIIGAGSGGATGGFIGVNIELFKRG